ncbi:hypothetical protein ACIO1C_29565 [Streptomyces sp. NPDC087420]|uniref:hypothetical protein n=1 Tax=Streptomyces sp. NPDC087420 TaxID=3365785 RepID=UPI003835F525
MGKPRGCQDHGFHEFEADSPAPVPLSEAPLYDVTTRDRDERRANWQAVADRAAEPHDQTGGVFKCACDAVSLLAEPETEPPLTPEEEEQVPPQLCHCGIGTPEECATGPAGCGPNSLDPRPPQPVRRPPYAVAYSVDGHLYEVALPGDATVTAVDGALVIKHTPGQVAGIVGIQPITAKEAS